MYKRVPLITGGTLRRIPSDNLIEIKTPGGGHSTNTVTTPVSLNSSSTAYSYNYGPPTATRPKNFHSTTITSTTIGSGGGVSPRQRARRAHAFRNHQLQHSTATDSSPGDEHVGGHRTSDPLLADRDRDMHRSAGGAITVHHPIGSGSERYSLTMTTPTSNTASEREPSFVPSPMEESYVSAPRPIHVQHHDESDFTTEKRPLLSHVDTPREQKAKVDYLRSEHV